MRITKFEEIEAWQEARKLVGKVYGLTGQSLFKKDLGLASQIQNAAVSVMSNIAEGFDSGSKAEFIRFLGYSRRSASEVQCQLYVAKDVDYITQAQFDDVYAQCERTRIKVSAFLGYLKGLPVLKPANRPTGQLVNRQTGQLANW